MEDELVNDIAESAINAMFQALEKLRLNFCCATNKKGGVLANPILFDKPILNVKGKLGFWDYDLPEEYEKLLKQ